MRVYEATVIDKCAYPAWTNEVATYESYIGVLSKKEAKRFKSVSIDEPCTPNITNQLKQAGLTDEDIHYYFVEDWFTPEDGVVETEEFKYLIGKRVA